MQPSGRPAMKDVPGMFTATPIPNAKEEPLDQQAIDRLNRLPLTKRFEDVAKRAIAWADAIQCSDQEKEFGLRVILDAVHSRVSDQEALVLILSSEETIEEAPPRDIIATDPTRIFTADGY